jgi:hypothetical protein
METLPDIANIAPRSSTSPFSPGHAKNGNHSTFYSKSSSVSPTLSPSYTPPCENLRCTITQVAHRLGSRSVTDFLFVVLLTGVHTC